MAIPFLPWIGTGADWLWNKIRGRPTVQADRGGVAAGRDQHVGGSVVTGAGPIVADRGGTALNIILQPGATFNVYVDRLPQAKPEVSEPFQHGQRLQRAEQHEAAINEFEKALAAADDDSQRCALHVLMGRSLWMRSRRREAVEHYRQALDFAQKAQDKEGEAFALGFLAMSYESLGERDAARAHFDRSLAVFGSMGDRDIQALILTHLAIGRLQRAEAGEAKALAERAAALRPLTPGHELTAFMSLVALGWACQLLDDPREASRAYAEALQMASVPEDDAPWVATVADVVPMLRDALEHLGSP